MALNKGYIAIGVVVVIVLGGLLAFLYFTQPLPTGTIIIGASVSQTGSLSVEGTGVYNGISLAVHDINAAGGFVAGGVRYNITFYHIDDASNKNTAATNYGTLINQDHAMFLIGPYGSSNVLSTAPVAEQYKIPMVQAGGSSDSIYTQGYTYTFGLYRLASTYSEPIFTYLNTSSHISDIHSVAVLVQNEPFSLSVYAGAQNFLSADGFANQTLTNGYKTYLHATGDLTTLDSQMTALKSAGGADMILAIGHYADAKEVVQDIASNG